MSLSGEDKEMRNMQGYHHHSLDQNLDQAGNHNHHHHPTNNLPSQDHEKSGDVVGGGGGATPLPYSGSGSKYKTPSRMTRYRECLKNHAANVGGNVTDGCGEFMPSGEEGTLEALKCAACNCHRNFHRKEQPNNVDNNGIMVVHPLQLPQPLPSMNHHHHHHHHQHGRSVWTSMLPQPVKMAFGGSGGGSGATDSSSEELNFNSGYHQQATSMQAAAALPQQPYVLAKKRFRTKFTQEQKDKMLEFAEKLGWRIPREDDTEVQRFCSQVGVKRQVFKVWMHNNKNPSAAKKTTLQDEP